MTTTTSTHLLLLAAAFLLVVALRTTSAENEIYESRGIKSVNGGEQSKTKGDKRPFFVGSRYGRSQSDIANMDSKATIGRMVPRNDRFFFGSRYGKRSAMPIQAVDEDNNSQPITCFYTGITNLFRCVENVEEQEK